MTIALEDKVGLMHSSKDVHVQVGLICDLHFLYFLIAMNVMMMMVIVTTITVVDNVNAIIFVLSEKDKKIRLLDSAKNTVTNHLCYSFVQ